MRNKHRVLWIEDGARFDLPFLAAPVYMHGGYDLVLAESATAAICHLREGEFRAIIVDIRLPPGHDPEWAGLYKRSADDKVVARLGLKLLHSILGSPAAEVKMGEDRPSWVTADRIGVLTVESRVELEDDLEELGIQVYQQKCASLSDTVLLSLIEQILEQQRPLLPTGGDE